MVTALANGSSFGHSEEVDQAVRDFESFESTEKTRLYSLVQLVAEKIDVTPVPSSGPISTHRSEALHLKKVDPPTFSGLEVDYPDFYRK